MFYTTFCKLFGKKIPVKTLKQDLKKEISPHITPALKVSIKEKNRLERLARKWPLTYHETYKRYRNNLTTLLREAKKLYYKQQLSENQGDPKKQWKILNSLLGKTGKDKSNVELHPPCMDIPSKLNEHFLRNYYDNDCTNVNYRNYLKNAPEFSMYMAPTDRFEVERVINSLNTNTPGYDDIPPLVLKRSSELITIPLTHIINLSLSNGFFPEQLKQAKVLPIFKSGDRFDMNNYRPISILPAFSNFF